ncbi:MAG: isoprenyl transferase [Balneolaceae bacterium]|nr:isoprenyl transferase [Balneolaceae bacterium]
MTTFDITNSKQSEEDKALQEAIKASGEIPQHIAVIMDGNGRWAQKQGGMRLLGHRNGVTSVRDITESCAQLGVKHLTLYAFSTENWGRPEEEVNGLMKLLVATLESEAETLRRNNIRLVTIGQCDRFPADIQKKLDEVKALTAQNTHMELCLALSYSGRWDITQAVQQIAQKVSLGTVLPHEIDDDMISDHLATAGKPDPDLVIRTSGEFRVSNFLLWQLAYSEFYVSSTFWPDFRRDDLYHAIESFQKRDRRFGKLSERHTKSIPSSVIRTLMS